MLPLLFVFVSLVFAQSNEAADVDPVVDLHPILYGFGTPEPKGNQRYWIDQKTMYFDLSKIPFPVDHLWEVTLNSGLGSADGFSCEYDIGWVEKNAVGDPLHHPIKAGSSVIDTTIKDDDSTTGLALTSTVAFLRGVDFPSAGRTRSEVSHIYISVSSCFVSRFMTRMQFNRWNGAAYLMDWGKSPIDNIKWVVNSDDVDDASEPFLLSADSHFPLTRDNSMTQTGYGWYQGEFAFNFTFFTNVSKPTLDQWFYVSPDTDGSTGPQSLLFSFCSDAEGDCIDSDDARTARPRVAILADDTFSTNLWVRYTMDFEAVRATLPTHRNGTVVYLSKTDNGNVDNFWAFPPFAKLWALGVVTSNGPFLFKIENQNAVGCSIALGTSDILLRFHQFVSIFSCDTFEEASYSFHSNVTTLNNPWMTLFQFFRGPQIESSILVTSSHTDQPLYFDAFPAVSDTDHAQRLPFETQISFNTKNLHYGETVTISAFGDSDVTFSGIFAVYPGSMHRCDGTPCGAGTCYEYLDTIMCVCPAGLMGDHCEIDVVECPEFGACLNGGACVDNVGAPGYTCECNDDWTGLQCERAADRCTVGSASGSGVCLHGGKCNSVAGALFTCDCTGTGYTGTWCEEVTSVCMVDFNLCGSGKCVPGVNAHEFTCDCVGTGMAGSHCHTPPACVTNPCMHGGECVADHETHAAMCLCNSMYTGAHCEELMTSLFDCRHPDHHCENAGTCAMNAASEYTCTCDPYHSGLHCETHVVCDPNPCMHGGNCMVDATVADHLKAPICVCTGNWFGDSCSESLRDYFDDCRYSPQSCQHGGTCAIVTDGGDSVYQCVGCDQGYTGEWCADAEVCMHDNGGCMHGATCMMGPDGSAMCHCTSEWVGAMCDMQLEDYIRMRFDAMNMANCMLSSRACQNGGECVLHSSGQHVCACLHTMYSGEMCEIPKVCEPNPCMNGGHCSMGTDGHASCACPGGHVGQHCEKTLEEFFHLNCHILPCENGGQCSQDGTCICDASKWVGEWCETPVACRDMHCHGGRCIGMDDGKAACLCPGNLVGESCEYDVEFGLADCRTSPCMNDGTCTRFSGSSHYACSCVEGWTGDQCHIAPHCTPSPCENGGRCVDNEGSAACLCAGSWKGAHCTENAEEEIAHLQAALLAATKANVSLRLKGALSGVDIGDEIQSNNDKVAHLAVTISHLRDELNALATSYAHIDAKLDGVATTFASVDDAKEVVQIIERFIIDSNRTVADGARYLANDPQTSEEDRLIGNWRISNGRVDKWWQSSKK